MAPRAAARQDEARSSGGVDASLTKRPARETSYAVTRAHPQYEVLLAKHPAPGLEAWFDAGLREIEDGDYEAVMGNRVLPRAYSGCNKDSVMIQEDKLGVLVWPVRIDLGDCDEGNRRPRTLYHFTHRVTFGRLVKFFGTRQEDGSPLDADDVYRVLFDELKADCKDRSATADPANPRGDPELLVFEPSAFRTKLDLLDSLFRGGYKEHGFSASGQPFNHFADFCFAVRVAACACQHVERLEAATASADSSRARTRTTAPMMRISQEAIEALMLRNAAREELARRGSEARADKSGDGKKSGEFGCFGRCFRGRAREKDWQDVLRERNQQQLEQALEDGRVCRDRKAVDMRVVELSDRWAKEHFSSVNKTKMRLEAQRQAEEAQEERRRAERESRHAAAAVAESDAPDEGSGNVKADAPKLAPRAPGLTVAAADGDETSALRTEELVQMAVADAISRGERLVGVRLVHEQLDKETLAMFRNYKERELGAKEYATPALARMKMRREEAQARAAAEAEAKARASARPSLRSLPSPGAASGATTPSGDD